MKRLLAVLALLLSTGIGLSANGPFVSEASYFQEWQRYQLWTAVDRARAEAIRRREARDVARWKAADAELARRVLNKTLHAAGEQFIFSRKSVSVDTAPTIVIQSPTAENTLATSASSIAIAGVASDNNGVQRVTWSVSPGGQSGVATGTTDWSVQAVAGSSIIGSDSFTPSGTNDDITGRTPTVGSAWVKRLDTGSTDTCQAYNATGTLRPSTTRTDEALICTLTPASALSGTNFTISAKRADAGSTGSAISAGLVFSYNTSNGAGCFVRWTNNSTVGLRLASKNSGGTVTVLQQVDYTVPNNATALIDQNGTTTKVLVDGVEKISYTNGANPCGTGEIGWFSGAAHLASNTGANQSTNSGIDDLVITDRGASTSAIPLSVGANVITVTAFDTAGNSSTDVITVTRSGGDAVAPSLTIDTPTSATTHSVTSATLAFGGDCLDNVACTSVAYSCTNTTCSPDSGSASLAGAATDTTRRWSVSFDLQCSTTPGTTNTVSFTPSDGTNTGTARTIDVNCATADGTAPVVTITSDGGSGAGANFSTTATSVVVSGTMTDAGGSGIPAPLTCTNSLGGQVAASGISPWQCTVPLVVGANVITASGADGAGNVGSDSVTVTRNAVTLASTISALPQATNGVPYAVCLTATGGTSPYTWTLNSGTLPGWASIQLDTTLCGTTNRYKLAGTPNAVATTNNLVFHVVDNVAAAANSATLSLTVVAAGADYITSVLGAQSDLYRQWDWRTAATAGANATGYLDNGGSQTADAVNGVKFVIPFWQTTAVTIAGSIGTTSAVHQCTAPTVDYTAQGISCIILNTAGQNQSAFACNEGRWFKRDNEIFAVTKPVGASTTCPAEAVTNTRGVYVRRAFNGTSAATHTAGSILWNANKEGNPNTYAPIGDLRLTLGPSPTSKSVIDGTATLYTWDFKIDPSMALVDSVATKTFNFLSCRSNKSSCDTITLEPRATGGVSPSVPTTVTRCNGTVSGTFNPGDQSTVDFRVYNQPGTTTDWLATNGDATSPPTTVVSDTACPMSALMFSRPNEWMRYWVVVLQRANDFDQVWVYYATESTGPTKMLDGALLSFSHNPLSCATCVGLSKFNYELDTSGDEPEQERINDYRDFVMYSRGFSILQQTVMPGDDIDDTTLNEANLISRGILVRPK